MKKQLSFIVLSIVFILLSCTDTSSTIEPELLSNEDLRIEYLESFPGIKTLDCDYSKTAIINFVDNLLPVYGRLLFYDKDLSINSSVSCGSCHQQSSSFADNVVLSKGFEEGLTTLNTPPLHNAGFGFRFLWDNSSRSLQQSSLNPIFDPLEMGLTETELYNRISSKAIYNDITDFIQFPGIPNDEIEQTKIAVGTALRSFINTLILDDAPFDRYLKKENSLDYIELQGLELFSEHCDGCHQVVNREERSSSGYRRNSPKLENIGFSRIAEENGNSGLGFRIPNLRNIEFTGPYMHDGRFSTIREVIDHYNSKVKLNDGLSSLLIDEETGNPIKLNLTEEEKKAIEMFLFTLSSDHILTEEKFSDPYF